MSERKKPIRRNYFTKCFTFDLDTYESLKLLAAENNTGLSQFLRQMIRREWNGYKNRQLQMVHNYLELAQ
jgi:hypothetical protein